MARALSGGLMEGYTRASMALSCLYSPYSDDFLGTPVWERCTCLGIGNVIERAVMEFSVLFRCILGACTGGLLQTLTELLVI